MVQRDFRAISPVILLANLLTGIFCAGIVVWMSRLQGLRFWYTTRDIFIFMESASAVWAGGTKEDSAKTRFVVVFVTSMGTYRAAALHGKRLRFIARKYRLLLLPRGNKIWNFLLYPSLPPPRRHIILRPLLHLAHPLHSSPLPPFRSTPRCSQLW
jgi:hypothetical protein